MHRFRTRRRPTGGEPADRRPSNDSQTPSPPSSSGYSKPTSRWRRVPDPPKPEIDIASALPSNDDFRTSLLMSGLSARFSMLREQDDPNTKLGKASDDSVLSPRRASRLNMDFRIRSDLSDIEEVASINGSIRPPFRSRHTEGYESDGYGTDDDAKYHSKPSILDRPRQADGNMLFGGRQKIYKIAPGGSTGKQLYDHDVSQTAFQKHRQAEKRRREALKALDSSSTPSPTLEVQGNRRPSEDSSPADSNRRSRDTSSSTHSHPSLKERSSTAATSVASGTPILSSAPLPNNGSFIRPTSPTFGNNNGNRPRRYEQTLDQHLADQEYASKASIWDIPTKTRPSQAPPKAISSPPDTSLQPPTQTFGKQGKRAFKNLAISTIGQEHVEPAPLTPASINSQGETEGERLLDTVPKSPPTTAVRTSEQTRPTIGDTLGRPPSKPDIRKSVGLPSFIDTDPNPGPAAGLRGLVSQHMRQDSGASSVYTTATGPARSPRFGPPGGMEIPHRSNRNTMASNASSALPKFDLDEFDVGYLGERDSMSSGALPSHHRSNTDSSRLMPEPLDVSTIGIAMGDTPQPTPLIAHMRDVSSVSTATQREQSEFIGELRDAKLRVQDKMRSYHEAGSPHPSDDSSPTLPSASFQPNPPMPKQQPSQSSMRPGPNKAMKMLGLEGAGPPAKQPSRPPTADGQQHDRDYFSKRTGSHHVGSPRSPLEALTHSFAVAQNNLAQQPPARPDRTHLQVDAHLSAMSHPSSSANSAITDISRFRSNSRAQSPASTMPSSVHSAGSHRGPPSREQLAPSRPSREQMTYPESQMGIPSISRPANPYAQGQHSPMGSGPVEQRSVSRQGSDGKKSSEGGKFANFMRRERKRSINKSDISEPTLVSRTTERLQTIDLRSAVDNTQQQVSDDVLRNNLVPLQNGRASPSPYASRPSMETRIPQNGRASPAPHRSGRASPAMAAFDLRPAPAIPPMNPQRQQRPSPVPARQHPPSTSSVSTSNTRSTGRPSSSRDGRPSPDTLRHDSIGGVPYSALPAAKPPEMVKTILPPSREKGGAVPPGVNLEKYKHMARQQQTEIRSMVDPRPLSPVGQARPQRPHNNLYTSKSMYVEDTASRPFSPPRLPPNRQMHSAGNSPVTGVPPHIPQRGHGPAQQTHDPRMRSESAASMRQDAARQHRMNGSGVFAGPPQPHPTLTMHQSHSNASSAGPSPISPSQTPSSSSRSKGASHSSSAGQQRAAFRRRGEESRERDRNDINKRSENLWGRLKKSTSDGGGLSSRNKAAAAAAMSADAAPAMPQNVRRGSREKRNEKRREENELLARTLREGPWEDDRHVRVLQGVDF